MDSIVYIISQSLIYFEGREIAQGGDEILREVSPKVSAKFWVNFRSSNFTKTATLTRLLL